MLCHQRDDRRRIDAARQKCPERNVGDHLHLGDAVEGFKNSICPFGLAAGFFFGRKVEVPPFVRRYLAVFPRQKMSGLELVNPLKHCVRRHRPEERQRLV